MTSVHQLSDQSSGSTTITVSGSCAGSEAQAFPGQGQSMTPMEVDSASGPQHDIDWQFYFDTLSPYLSTSIDELAAFLDLSSDDVDSIRKQYRTEHERCFHVLWSWLMKCPSSKDTERLTSLQDALKDAGRKTLAEQGTPTRNMYKYEKNVNGQNTYVQRGKEALKIAKGVADDSARLGRYFQLKEVDIARIVSNTADTRKQGQQIVEACINQNLLHTRQQLCDGLNYIGNKMLIDELNENWS